MVNNYTNQDVLNFLRNNPIMNIAANNGGKPLSSVVAFVVDSDFTFYFVTHKNSYKAKALELNPGISFSIWKHNELLVQGDGVAITGTAHDLDQIISKIASATVKIEDFWPPLLQMEDDFYECYIIKPVWLRVLDLSSKNLHTNEPPFTVIEIE